MNWNKQNPQHTPLCSKTNCTEYLALSRGYSDAAQNSSSWLSGHFVMSNVYIGVPGGSAVKNPLAMQDTWVQLLVLEDLLEKEMATHSSILAWEIPWTEEPSRLQSMDLQELDMT